jgi:hypothetical protein
VWPAAAARARAARGPPSREPAHIMHARRRRRELGASASRRA